MSDETGKKIRVSEEGPYIVEGNIPVNQFGFIAGEKGFPVGYQKIQDYLDQETCALCRCGESHTKPFCDSSHEAVHFEGKESASHADYDQMAKTIPGKMLDLMDAEELCARARFCDTHGTTWKLVEEATTENEKEIAIDQCKNCPSGRLTAVTKDGIRIEPELPQEISVLEDTPKAKHGPLWIKGGIEIEDATGNPYPVRNRVTLCRCGKSTNKPFCDGNHLD